MTDFFERQVADYFDDELGGKLDHQDRSPVRARASGRQRSRIAFFAQVGVGALRPRVRPHRGLLVLPDLSPNAIFYERPGCCSSCHLDGSILGFKGCVGISLVQTDFVRSMKSETLEMRRNWFIGRRCCHGDVSAAWWQGLLKIMPRLGLEEFGLKLKPLKWRA